MIGRITGILLEKKPPQLLVDVGGIGYELAAPMTTFYHLPEVGERVQLFTHLVVREDAHLLYGFIRLQDRLLFRQLIKTSGVGPKSALAILSGINADEFVGYIMEGDALSLTRIPGIGKKTAERLIIEMRDRLVEWHKSPLAAAATADSSMYSPGSARQDAISALVALGYKPQQASRAVSAIKTQVDVSEDLIRLALKEIV